MPQPITGINVFTDPVIIPVDGEPVVQTGPGGIGVTRVYQALANRDVHLGHRITALEGGASKGLRQVENEAQLRAMSGMVNAEHVYFAGNGFYRYALAGTTTEAPPYVYMPNNGIGRWYLEAPRLTDTYLRTQIDALLAGHLTPSAVTTGAVWSGTVYTNNIAPQTGGDVTAHAALTAQRMNSTSDVFAAGNVIASGGILQLAGINLQNVAGVFQTPHGGGFMSWAGVMTAQHLRAYSGGWTGNTLSFGAGDADRWLFTTDVGGALHLQFYAGGAYQYTILSMAAGMPWFPRGIRLDHANELHGDYRGYVSTPGGFWAGTQIHAGDLYGHIAAGDSTRPGWGSINCYGNLTTMYLNGVWTGALMARMGLTEADIDDNAPQAEECHRLFRLELPKYEKAQAEKAKAAQEKVLQELQEVFTKAEAADAEAVKAVAAHVEAGPPETR